MRVWVAAGLVLSLAGCVATAAPSLAISTPPLSRTLPSPLPPADVLARWERIDGEYTNANEHVRYSLFVDPKQPLLFRITQYRVSLRLKGGDGTGLGYAWETVIWNEHPGQRVPLRCFTEDRRRTWQTLWLAPVSTWRDVTPHSQEFKGHMRRALEIYIRVRNEGRAGPSAG